MLKPGGLAVMSFSNRCAAARCPVQALISFLRQQMCMMYCDPSADLTGPSGDLTGDTSPQADAHVRLFESSCRPLCRCFPTKAISVWTATDDRTHAYIVGAYFHYSVPGGFTEPKAVDISPGAKGIFGGGGDPMYVVYARKSEA